MTLRKLNYIILFSDKSVEVDVVLVSSNLCYALATL